MKWHIKAITNFYKEYSRAVIAAAIFVLSLILYHLFFGGSFNKEIVCQLPEPSFTLRILSGLVFATFGRLLYKLQVYKVLFFVLVVIFRRQDIFDALKKVIWCSMMFFVGFVFAPWVIDQLNVIFLYACNAPLFLMHLFPPYGLSLVALILFIVLVYKKKILIK